MPLIRYTVALILLLALVELLYVFTKTPQNERDWLPEQSRTATALIAADRITLFNVRDWTYDTSGPLTTEWTTATIDPSQITRAWFLIEPFSDWEAVGHTFLSFELVDGRVYSFSVEARREAHETYSAIRGAFNEYELSYQWGTERDFVTRRLVYLNHPLRRYPLTLSPQEAQALFRSLVAETNALADKPRFYHTLTSNCTNVLAAIVNRHYPGTLPIDASWFLTGYADRYLMDEGLIKRTGSTEETMGRFDLTRRRAELQAQATTSPSVFSALLRTDL